MLVTILDGFVDEPSCFGVPPYISPYIRYIAGAIKDAGHEYEYITIEDWRKGRRIKGRILLIFAGAIVPGKYLRGMPISWKEIKEITSKFRGIKILAGSAAVFGLGQGGGKRLVKINNFFDYSSILDGDAFIYDFLNGEIAHRRRSNEEWKRWAIMGAEIVKQHPDLPQPLIAEIETYRGCIRWFNGGCSFCMEPSFGKPAIRSEREILMEIKELMKHGVKNFRLGCQSCFFSYKAIGIGKSETPKPNVNAIKRLLEGIAKLKPSVLHIDNANPAVIAEWENESIKIAELLKKYATPGNVAAFGMESADERVIKENNLNAQPWQVMKAIEILNEIGREKGWNGMPYILPGLNLLFGLKGESEKTYIKNYEFLKEILEKDLLLRRINIRQVVNLKGEKVEIDKDKFKRFKKKVNKEIDRPMLQRLLPYGSILRDVYLELNIGNATYGRQIGTYPILIYLPYKTKINRFVDVKIYDHGFRSVSAIEYPFNINKASYTQLKSIPKISSKAAAEIVKRKPIKDKREVKDIIDDELENWITI
ncbi:MAG: radical SAM protein [Thermoplasmata archaeon]|nr:MAG: radical SAM protein [Thermoplasmata archaeon]